MAPPGGVAGDLSPEGNLGAWLDRALFGTHLWKTTWDPEGLLSSLPAVGTTLMGVVAGLWIARSRPRCAAPVLVYGGLGAIVAGLMWDVVFPINKSLWTSSYALFAGGVAMLVFGLLHRRLDDGRSTPMLDRLSEPFVALGRNALLLFVLSGLVGRSIVLLTVNAQRWQPRHLAARHLPHGVCAVGEPEDRVTALRRDDPGGALRAAGVAAPATVVLERMTHSMGRRSVVVVGAGVFGAWTALRLARDGWRVTLVDAYGPANGRASSSDHSRVIRAGYGALAIYTRWATDALTDWQWLAKKSGEGWWRSAARSFSARPAAPTWPRRQRRSRHAA